MEGAKGQVKESGGQRAAEDKKPAEVTIDKVVEAFKDTGNVGVEQFSLNPEDRKAGK